MKKQTLLTNSIRLYIVMGSLRPAYALDRCYDFPDRRYRYRVTLASDRFDRTDDLDPVENIGH